MAEQFVKRASHKAMRRAVTVTPKSTAVDDPPHSRQILLPPTSLCAVLGLNLRKPTHVDFFKQRVTAASGKQTDWKAAEEPGSEVQNDVIVTPTHEQAEQAERALQLFDMDMAFGPCTGLSRLERWQRANRLGLNPPPHVRALLESASCREDSVWEGRV
ncbi:unnamed protein product [Closterium sp. Naga37s-1]|nr:unnamed protein product [Closterium sp. Naga37s-1]